MVQGFEFFEGLAILTRESAADFRDLMNADPEEVAYNYISKMLNQI